jgi:hypothetical protein
VREHDVLHSSSSNKNPTPPVRIRDGCIDHGCNVAERCNGADCAPLRPSKLVNTEVADRTKAEANVLLRSLGSGTIDNDFKSIEEDLLSKYPNADRLHVWDSFVYMLCTILASSKTLSDDQKLSRYDTLVNEWQHDSPPRGPEDKAAGGTRSGGNQGGGPQSGSDGRRPSEINQSTQGNCSPAIAGVGGNVQTGNTDCK